MTGAQASLLANAGSSGAKATRFIDYRGITTHLSVPSDALQAGMLALQSANTTQNAREWRLDAGSDLDKWNCAFETK